MHSKRYMTLEEIDEIHKAILQASGGYPGYRDKGLVDSAINRPRTGYYNNLFEEAAAMMESISNNQGFVDGNKRTAFVATDTFLRWNGFYLEIDPQEAHDFMVKASKQKIFKKELILEWIFQIYERMEESEAAARD
jgi:death-on-curing protein